MTQQNHFGFKPNQHVCNCGKHYGYGTLTAEERYKRAKSVQERLPMYMTPHMRGYIWDWEKHHMPLNAPVPKNYHQPYAD